MEKVQADSGQPAVVASGVNCHGGCVRDELEESELMEEGGEEQSILTEISTKKLKTIVAYFSGLLATFEGHCCQHCQAFNQVKILLPQFKVQLKEAKEELARRKVLTEQ